MRSFLFAAAPALIALSATATAQRAPVMDPADNPRVRQPGAVQQVPGQVAPAMPLPPLPVLQADFANKSGSNVVSFSLDSHTLDEDARRTLALQANWLRLNPMVRANIEGHADGRQSRDYALALAERRAAAVYSFLVAQGVPPSQLSIVSWGKERPAVEGAHEATWLQNSRVVTVLLPPAPAAPPLFIPQIG